VGERLQAQGRDFDRSVVKVISKNQFKYLLSPKYRRHCKMGWDYETTINPTINCTMWELLGNDNAPVDVRRVNPEFVEVWEKNRVVAIQELYRAEQAVRVSRTHSESGTGLGNL